MKLKELTFHRMTAKSHVQVQKLAAKLLDKGKKKKESRVRERSENFNKLNIMRKQWLPTPPKKNRVIGSMDISMKYRDNI